MDISKEILQKILIWWKLIKTHKNLRETPENNKGSNDTHIKIVLLKKMIIYIMKFVMIDNNII